MSELRFDDTVDITDVVCPVTFVKAKVAIEELDDGQILAVRMNDGEPVQKVLADPSCYELVQGRPSDVERAEVRLPELPGGRDLEPLVA